MRPITGQVMVHIEKPFTSKVSHARLTIYWAPIGTHDSRRNVSPDGPFQGPRLHSACYAFGYIGSACTVIRVTVA